ncbi:MAG: tetratricopeptide repeat protein [Isosphaeraceae bacterium]
MVRSSRRLLAGLVLIPLLAAAAPGVDAPPAKKPDDKPKAEPKAARANDAAARAERAKLFALPGEDPPQPFVPLKPRTVEDRERVEALTEFSVARALEDRRNWSDAIVLLEKALKREPESVTILRRLSRLCFILGRTENGIEYSKRVLTVDPGDTETITRLVNYYNNRRNDPAGAEAVLTDVLKNPKLDAHASGRLIAEFELGKLYATKLRRTDKAADSFAKVIEALDDRAANRLSPADQRRILGGDEAGAYQQFGQIFLEAGRLELAVKAFERGLDYDPDDPQLPSCWPRRCKRPERTSGALSLVEGFLKRQPQGVEGYDLQAKVLTALKRENEITPKLEEAARKDSKNVVLQYALVDRYRETGQVEKADALEKQLLATQPTTQGFGARAASLFKRRKAEELIKVISEAVGRPGGLEAVQEPIKGIVGDPAFAEQVLDAGAKLMEADPPALAPQGVTVLAYIANRANKLEKFLPIQVLQLKRNPNPQAFKEVAAVQAGLRKFADSAATIEEMITRYPVEKNTRTLAELIRLYRMADNTEKALAVARESLKLDPNDLDLQVQLATVLSQTGKSDEAVDLLRQATKRDPNNPEPAAMLGGTLVQVGRNEEGIAVFKGLIEKFPNNEQVIKIARQNLSIAYVNLGDYAKGEAELEILLEKNPDDPGVNNDLGYLYADQGKNLEKAEAMIRKAVSEEPDYSAYLDSLGWVLFKRGKVKEALEPLEKAVKKLEETSGTDSTIWEHLGDVYFQLKDASKARNAWEAARKAAAKSNPPDKRLTEIQKKLESLDKLGKVPRPATGDAP